MLYYFECNIYYVSELNDDLFAATHVTHFYTEVSVTRFGEISPLLHTVKNIWPFWKGSFNIWQKT